MTESTTLAPTDQTRAEFEIAWRSAEFQEACPYSTSKEVAFAIFKIARRAPAPASQPAAAHTDPESYQDGAWYWVKTNGFGGNSITAPAMYKANVGAWYSYEFAGISTRFIDVLGPCKPASAANCITAAQKIGIQK